MNAKLKDLCNELWLRNRNNGVITWTTKDGETIPIKDLDDQHLVNIVKHLLKLEEQQTKHLDMLENYDTDLFWDTE